MSMTTTLESNLEYLASFLTKHQWQFLSESIDPDFSEEYAFFEEKVNEYANRIKTMPVTYKQDGLGDDAIVYLHYFVGGADWYITEKDKSGVSVMGRSR